MCDIIKTGGSKEKVLVDEVKETEVLEPQDYQCSGQTSEKSLA
jgi:hypothetical protein